MKKKALVLFFSLIGISLFAQEGFGVWTLEAKTDRFGDPTGSSYYFQVVMGEGKNSIGSTSSQVVGITYPVADVVAIGLKDTSMFGFPLNMLFMGHESITLYVKDSTNKTYSFNGTQVSSDDGMVTIAMNNNSSLVSLLRQKGSYKAVIEGDRWSCSFTFNGGMPQ
jgi:hypothetical protein